MVNAISAGTHRFDETAQASRAVVRPLLIEDLDSPGQSDAVMFSICIIAVPAAERSGQFAA
ncbi:hypothetical protein [Streptomyces flaveus]|uniref:Uncharacterized protein n=1 Tax=Streptomyces flaveus TaxID=66370 RepID=A0A917VIJ8_9ACTN|nr:hypothetical protein [Streptomyces flaveus]GGK82690.1 hypothetical protein GCM10010094_49760 [Streptomyces flaveus]